MTDLDRLLAEELPTGRWGGPRVAPPTWWEPITTEQAAANYTSLAEAIDGWRWHDDGRPHHLHAVPEPGAGAA